MQRAMILTVLNLVFALSCSRQCTITIDRHPRLEAGLKFVDTLKTGVNKFDRGQLAGANLFSGVSDCE
jgi:hypothetical protein